MNNQGSSHRYFIKDQVGVSSKELYLRLPRKPFTPPAPPLQSALAPNQSNSFQAGLCLPLSVQPRKRKDRLQTKVSDSIFQMLRACSAGVPRRKTRKHCGLLNSDFSLSPPINCWRLLGIPSREGSRQQPSTMSLRGSVPSQKIIVT